MRNSTAITCAFLDIGGVLLTMGGIIWPANARHDTSNLSGPRWRSVTTSRSSLRRGKITLDEYLRLVVFHQSGFLHAPSFSAIVCAVQGLPAMIELLLRSSSIWAKGRDVSNEARELNAYRVGKFNLNQLADCLYPLLRSHPQTRSGYVQVALI